MRTDWLRQRQGAYQTEDWHLKTASPCMLRRQPVALVTSDDQATDAVEDWRDVAFLWSLKQRLEAICLEVFIGDGSEDAQWFIVKAPWLRGASSWSRIDFLQAILCFHDREQAANHVQAFFHRPEQEQLEEPHVVKQQFRDHESSAATLHAEWLQVVENDYNHFFLDGDDTLPDTEEGEESDDEDADANQEDQEEVEH